MKPSRKKFTWRNLIGSVLFLFGDLKKKYLIGTFFIFVLGFYVVLPPLLLGKIVDFFIGYKPNDSLTLFYVYVAILGISYSVVSFFRLSTKRYIDNLQTEAVYKLKVLGFERLLNLSIRWHDQENTGNKIFRIENGLGAFRSILYLFKDQVLPTISAFIGVIVIFLFLSPIYVVFFVIYLLGFAYVLQHYYAKTLKLANAHKRATENAGGSFVEGVSNIMTIKTLGAGSGFQSHIQTQEAITKEYEFARREVGMNMWKVFQIYNGFCTAIFLLMVGQGVVSGAITAGAIVIFFGYLDTLIGNSGRILSIYEKIVDDKSGVARMMPIFRHPEEDTLMGEKDFPENWDKLSISNGNFDYDERLKAKVITLRDINIEFPRGSKIGMVGKTGSGKSTLSKLLMGLYKFGSGSYLVGETSFYDIKNTDMYDKMAIVLQDSEMFNLPLRDNITLLREVKPDLLENAIKIAQLTDVIAKLPKGLDTLIGEKGYHLSGGERQRVGIARAICKNPEIIIFDEATSSLDNKTESLVLEGIDRELTNKTMIIMAHRVTTLKNVDKIYVFRKGRIVESGTYEELSKKPESVFSRIYTAKN